MTDARTKVIACQPVGEELKTLLPDGMEMEVLEYGLHNVPENLHIQLQAAIDRTSPDVGTILIGYGMCASALMGIQSRSFRLVIPRADDCITLFLGSREAFKQQFTQNPGTYYLTKGWVEHGEDPYTEYCKMKDKFGKDKAFRITKQYIAHYTRLALIISEYSDSEAYRKYAKMVAEHFELDYEEVEGSYDFLRKLVQGEWDEDFVIVPPGEVVQYELFYSQGG